MTFLFWELDIQVWHAIVIILLTIVYRVWDTFTVNVHLEALGQLFR